MINVEIFATVSQHSSTSLCRLLIPLPRFHLLIGLKVDKTDVVVATQARWFFSGAHLSSWNRLYLEVVFKGQIGGNFLAAHLPLPLQSWRLLIFIWLWIPIEVTSFSMCHGAGILWATRCRLGFIPFLQPRASSVTRLLFLTWKASVYFWLSFCYTVAVQFLFMVLVLVRAHQVFLAHIWLELLSKVVSEHQHRPVAPANLLTHSFLRKSVHHELALRSILQIQLHLLSLICASLEPPSLHYKLIHPFHWVESVILVGQL